MFDPVCPALRRSRNLRHLSGGLNRVGLGRRRTVSAEEITGFKAIRGMQVGNHLFYRIQMSVLNGDRYIVASQLDSLDLAQHLIREFENQLKAAG